jgi:hypothetical protein
MPAGGLIQLVTARGEQDLYIIGNPQISLFKTVYRRHTNFSCETVREIFGSSIGGSPANFGKTTMCTLPVIGDLVTNLTLNVNLGSLNPEYDLALLNAENNEHVECDEIIGDNGQVQNNICACQLCIEEQYKEELLFGWVNSLGHALVKSTWITIGGVVIDKQYGEWLEIWIELTQTQEKRDVYYQMIGKVDHTAYTATTFTGDMELYIPLNFWFCKNYGLALPIISLYNQQIQVYVDFRKFKELWIKNKSIDQVPKEPFFDASLLIEYVYLDVDERQQIYDESHMYLIEQVQASDDYDCSALMNPIHFYFNHPTKELIWVVQRNDVVGKPQGVFAGTNYPVGNDWFNYSSYKCRAVSKIKDPYKRAVIQFNGENRFTPMPASYFRLLQPYYRHTRGPVNYIYTYSFAIKPEEHQPTGHINLSQVDNMRLVIEMRNDMSTLELSSHTARVYGTNYNILVITEGMGGLLFAN